MTSDEILAQIRALLGAPATSSGYVNGVSPPDSNGVVRLEYYDNHPERGVFEQHRARFSTPDGYDYGAVGPQFVICAEELVAAYPDTSPELLARLAIDANLPGTDLNAGRWWIVDGTKLRGVTRFSSVGETVGVPFISHGPVARQAVIDKALEGCKRDLANLSSQPFTPGGT